MRMGCDYSVLWMSWQLTVIDRDAGCGYRKATSTPSSGISENSASPKGEDFRTAEQVSKRKSEIPDL
jgi:hypothetical protein